MNAVSRIEAPPGTLVGRLLLASEGRPISEAAIAVAMSHLAPGGEITILSIARIWGSALGLPNPWLLPSKQEWQAQRDLVAAAAAILAKHGITATSRVVGTRNAARRIAREAQLGGFETIVMSADPDRSRLIGELFWTQEPQRVRRLARVPVILVNPPA
jgi:nucleotide-binding universal stress UspA family protein